MENKILYRVCFVEWRDRFNSDTYYVIDFDTYEQAYAYIMKRDKEYADYWKAIKRDFYALCVDIETWGKVQDKITAECILLFGKELKK